MRDRVVFWLLVVAAAGSIFAFNVYTPLEKKIVDLQDSVKFEAERVHDALTQVRGIHSSRGEMSYKGKRIRNLLSRYREPDIKYFWDRVSGLKQWADESDVKHAKSMIADIDKKVYEMEQAHHDLYSIYHHYYPKGRPGRELVKRGMSAKEWVPVKKGYDRRDRVERMRRMSKVAMSKGKDLYPDDASVDSDASSVTLGYDDDDRGFDPA